MLKAWDAWILNSDESNQKIKIFIHILLTFQFNFRRSHLNNIKLTYFMDFNSFLILIFKKSFLMINWKTNKLEKLLKH